MKKIALITGASSGIGKETARLLLENHFTVYGAARRIEKMRDIESLGARVIKMDVTDDQSMAAGVDGLIAAEGRIDVLVNNAGYGSYGAVEDVPIEEARRQFEVNIFGLARLCQLVLPYMRRNTYGKIVNMSSMGGKLYTPLGGWYHATKHALEGLSDCLRIETQAFGIDVIIIEPGAIQSEWGDIAIESMLRTSGQTAYAGLAQATARMFKKSYDDPKISSPRVIAKVILEAVTAKKPATRYIAGHMARPYLWTRKFMPDRMFDQIILSAAKKAGKPSGG